MNTVIFGGSFNPIHTGHLQMLQAAAELDFVDRVLLLPDNIPPHKMAGEDFASPLHRSNMCKILCLAEKKAEFCDLELLRGGKSYMIDTVLSLKKLYPEDNFYLLVGADMAITLEDWKEGPALLGEVGVIAVGRNTVDGDELNSALDRYKARGTEVIFIEKDISPISSTAVRKALADGDISVDIPSGILKYILRNGLYMKNKPMTDDMIIEAIKGRLSAKRFNHSLEVAKEARRLALLYGADGDRLYTAGLLHDAMKDSSAEEQLKMLSVGDIILSDLEKSAFKLWHARSGEIFARYVAGIEDEEILSAIRYHTTARAGMSLFEKILYIADFTSADRTYNGVEDIRAAANKSLDIAFKEGLAFTVADLVASERPVHPDTINAYNEIVLKGSLEK